MPSHHGRHATSDEGRRDARNRDLYGALRARGIETKLETFDGSHTWGFWRQHLVDGLTWLADRLR